MSFGKVSTSSDALSTVVVSAVAEHEGVNPLELKQPLYDVIDTDALDAIFNGATKDPGLIDAQITFPYNGYHVTVTSDGDVTISDSPE